MIIKEDTHLMFIEPKDPIEEPINDEVTKQTINLMEKCEPSEYSYRGFHLCSCGERSGTRDLFTPKGRKTNSLLVHYVKYHRNEIPPNEVKKLLEELDNCHHLV